jgi:hypothetical protein
VTKPFTAAKLAACSATVICTIWQGTSAKPQIAAAWVRCWPSMMAYFPPSTGATNTGEKRDHLNRSAMRLMAFQLPGLRSR